MFAMIILVHFAKIYAIGIDEGEASMYMIMQHLGENLADIFEKCGKKFSHATIVMLLKEMVCEHLGSP